MTRAQAFKRFVIFAEMRTGSNLLESTLNNIKRVTCYGEAFNPYLLGWPDCGEMRGVTQAERDADPLKLLAALFDRPNHLSGFRYFHDHDPRVLDAIMDDHDCAKIVLTRNPVDSYVSTLLARETNQWKLNESESAIPAAVTFDPQDFRDTLGAMEDFAHQIQHRLQASGQVAFWLGYEDLRDSAVLTGLLHWLGRTDLERVEPGSDLVPQNPRELSEKVANFAEMEVEIARLDPFKLHKLPNFEPRRGPTVPAFLASEGGRGLIFMPVRGGPTDAVIDWLSATGDITRDFGQNDLRQWKRHHPGHRSFTVLRDPVFRAWIAFEALVESKPELRQALRDTHRVALPPDEALLGMKDSEKLELFPAFLDFLRRNLNGQTSLPVHPGWASQSETLAGFARFSTPDVVLRESTLADDLEWVARSAGLADMHAYHAERMPDFLKDKTLTKLAKAAYQRDYVTFGLT